MTFFRSALGGNLLVPTLKERAQKGRSYLVVVRRLAVSCSRAASRSSLSCFARATSFSVGPLGRGRLLLFITSMRYGVRSFMPVFHHWDRAERVP